MQNTQTCPKCDGRKLWRIEKFRAPDSKYKYGSDGIPLLLAQGRYAAPDGTEEKKGFLDRPLFGGDHQGEQYWAGSIDAWLCAACGYTEFWSHSFEKLSHNPADGVHFIDATPEQGGFR